MYCGDTPNCNKKKRIEFYASITYLSFDYKDETALFVSFFQFKAKTKFVPRYSISFL